MNFYLKKCLDLHLDLSFEFQSDRSGPPLGRDISIRITSDNQDNNNELAALLEEYLRKRKGVTEVSLNNKAGKKRLQIQPSMPLISLQGISLDRLAKTFQISNEGMVTRSRLIEGHRMDIRVLGSAPSVKDDRYFKNIPIRNHKGLLVSVGTLCSFKEQIEKGAIYRYQGFRSVSVLASVDTELTTSRAETALIKEKFIPLAREKGILLHFEGVEKNSENSFRDFIISFSLAISCIYLLMVLFFNSYFKPFLIMSIIPFGILSVFLVFILHAIPLSFLGTIGLIGLLGVMINDSLVMVSGLLKIPKQDISVKSIALAASHRLRPVLMTTLTSVLGLMPLVYGWGGKERVLIPIVMSISWGLVFVTVVTLLIVPLLFLLISKPVERIRR